MKTIALLSGTLLIASCEKEGPAGPQGPQGPAGDDGTSVVINGIFTSPDVYSGGATTFNYLLTTPLLTQQVIETHVIEAYVSTSSGWTALPFEFPVGDGVTLLYRGFADVGVYKVNMKRSDGQVIDAGDPLDSMNPLSLKLIVFSVNGMSQEEVDQLRGRLLAE